MRSVLYLLKIKFVLGVSTLSVRVFSLTEFPQPDTVYRWPFVPF